MNNKVLYSENRECEYYATIPVNEIPKIFRCTSRNKWKYSQVNMVLNYYFGVKRDF